MATSPNTPTTPNKGDFDGAMTSLKLTEQTLANVEQKFQRLALLQKSIELQIIDPKDLKNFEKFIKDLSRVDVTNLTELKKLGGYIGASAKKMNELSVYASNINKQSESYVQHLVEQKNEYRQIILNSERLVQSQKKSTQQSKRSISTIDEFNDGLKDALDSYGLTVDIQGKVQKGLDAIRSGQVSNMGLANAFAQSYTDLASNLGESIAAMGGKMPEISPIVDFEFVEGFQEKIREYVAGILKSVGQETFEIEGMVISSDMRDSIFDTLSSMFKGAGETSSDLFQGTINTLTSDISKSLGIASDIAAGLIEDMINDQAALATGLVSILTPQRQKEVQDFYVQLQKSGDVAQKAILGYTISAKIAANAAMSDINAMSKQMKAMPNLDSLFSNLNASADDVINQLQHVAENLMPRWMSTALGVDGAFASIKTNSGESIQNLIVDLQNGGSKMEALGKFTQSFSLGLLKALGPITLVVISVTALWKMMSAAGESVKELSTEFGVSSSTASDMHKNILGITSAIDNTIVKQEHVLDVLKRHRDEYGLIMDLNNKASQDAIKFSTELGKQYGLGSGEVYGFTQQLQQLGADAAASQEMAAVAAYASDLSGIPFNAITKDLAESSEFVATQFAGMPQKAVATVAKLRAMGTSLKSVEKTVDKVFDTSNFLKSMTELNIMTRGVVDLTSVFSKTLKGDVEGAAIDVAKQFDKMVASGQTNMYQMRQFAQATGQSVEELMKGNKIRKQQAALGKDNVELLSKYLDKLSDADVADAKSAMTAAKRLSAAEKLDSIWASIKDTLMEALMPALEGMSDLITAIAPALKIISVLFKGIGILIKGFAAPIALFFDVISGIKDIATGSTPKFERIKSLFGEWNSVLGSVANIAGIIVGILAGKKMLNAIGNITGGWEGIRETIKNVSSSKFDFGSIGNKIKDVLPDKLKKFIPGMDISGPASSKTGGKKTLLNTGLDKLKDLFGGGTTKTGADALTEAANELKIAADMLSGSGSTITNSLMDFPDSGSKDKNVKGGRRTSRLPGDNSPRRMPRTRLRPGRIPTPASSVGSKAGNMLKGAGNMLKGPGSLKLLKGLGVGAIFTAAGMGADYLGDKYKEKAMESGNKSDLQKGRALKAGGSALKGAGYGAMVGSIIPGLGTAVGAAIGGTIGGAIGIWENYFSDDAKRQTEQLQQIKSGNKILNGLVDLTEGEMQQLKDAGYSDELIKQISAGNISLETAIKEQFSELNLSEDQLKKLADANTTGKERDIIMQSAAGIPTPSLKVGTNLVKSDGLAMLHKNEAVVPAKVVKGGFTPVSQKVAPVTNEMSDISAISAANKAQSSEYNESQMPAKPRGNQDALLKQFMSIMQDVANRPVQVQIAGVELKALNNKMKVLNNKA